MYSSTENMSSVSVGIHLGTSSSSISVYLKENVKIIDRGDIVEYTGGFDRFNINDPFGHESHYQTPPLPEPTKQVSAKNLSYLKKQAENYLKSEVNNAVVSVPASFNDAQRQATRAAGIEAGFKDLCIINEHNAVAIAYNLHGNDSKLLLLFHFGRNKFDVSLLKLEGGIEILERKGGEHFIPADFVDSRFKVPHSGRPFWDTFGPTDSRKFEQIENSFFQKCIDTVDQTIKNVKLTPNDIDELVLVGDSSETPGMKTKLSNYFNGKKFLDAIPANQVVAYGAAIKASNYFRIQNSSRRLKDQQMTQLKTKVRELFHQRSWEFDEDMQTELHHWLENRET